MWAESKLVLLWSQLSRLDRLVIVKSLQSKWESIFLHLKCVFEYFAKVANLPSKWKRYLIESIIQALVELVQIAQNDCVSELHRNLDPVNVEADLPVLLVVGETRAEDDVRVFHV